MSDFWNSRFGQEEYIYGTEPNSFFKNELARLSPGKILLPAEGEGRNGVHAARSGWEVMAFDPSIEGKKKAHRLAEKYDVNIDYKISSYQDFYADESTYQVIALIFAHMPSELRKYFHSKLVTWLSTGGRIILEAFHKSQLGLNSGGPKDLDMLFDLDDLHHDFQNLKIIHSEIKTINLAEGNYHIGKANVVRFVAEKI
jgi:2-polyprenyl-3-methyl-5-hydroxy-6-metoxy-1,4-benzoquinol methylase